MIASIVMYHYPWTAAAHDRLWSALRDALRDHGIAAPEGLDRETGHMEAWGRPDLVLSQICNLPLRAQFWDRVTRIACCDYGLDGTDPGYYRSVWIVRADDPATGLAQAAHYPMALNEPLSQSGWGAPSQHAAALGLTLNPILRTGAHRLSLAAVAEGRADLACIDGITFRNLAAHDPLAARVKVIGQTHQSPGMTMITRAGQDPAPYRAALDQGIAALTADDRTTLGLRGVVTLPDAAYDIPLPVWPAGMAA
jgi:ABC-type phosphate/phosphonate transport system substrate-binding protein